MPRERCSRVGDAASHAAALDLVLLRDNLSLIELNIGVLCGTLMLLVRYNDGFADEKL